MQEVIITSSLVNIAMALISFLMVWGMLRVLDKLSGMNFRERVGRMDDQSFAIYAGLRLLAFCILVGLAIS